jgi:hypothetical protein
LTTEPESNDLASRQGGEVTTAMIEAGAKIIADRFDLPVQGWEANDLAKDVLRAALDARG